MPIPTSKGLPAARLTDGVTDGIIIQGEPTVLIGSGAKPVACKECKARQLKGNPVNTSSGAKVEPIETDFALPAPLLFAWQRFYASDTPFIGLLGQGWRTSIELACHVDRNRTRLIDIQGRWIDFVPLSAGEEQFSPSEGVWLARGSHERRVRWDGRWQWLPEQYRYNLQYLIATTGDGDYLVFESGLAPAPAHDNPQTSATGSHDLVAILNRHGYRTAIRHGQFHNARHQVRRLPEFITDSGNRIYRLHYLALETEHEHQPNIRHPQSEDPGLRLTGISLSYDPRRDEAAPDFSRLRDQRVSEWLVRYHFNAEGDLAEVQNGEGGWQRRFEYRQHLMTRHQTPGSRADTVAADVSYEYDRYHPDGKVLRQIQDGGLTYSFVYDPDRTIVTDNLGRVTQYRFEGDAGLRRLVELTHPDDSVISMAYTRDGHMYCFTDALGRQTYFHHSRFGEYLGSTNPLGHRDYRLIDAATGLVSGTRNAEAQITHYRRDTFGNITRVTAPDGSQTFYQYDYPHFPDRPSAVINTRGGKQTPTYNELGQLESIIDCSGNTTRYHYDAKGHLQAIEDAEGKQIRFRRDRKGRIIALTLPDGREESVRYDYAGRIVQTVDAAGRAIAIAYNRHGQITEHRIRTDKSAAGGADNSGWSITRYEYDAAQRLIRITDAAGAHMLLKYDAMDRLIEEIGFDNKRSAYRYNPAGELVSHIDGTDGDAIEILYLHDVGGRLIARHLPARNGTPQQVQRFAYNKLNQLTCATTYNSQVEFAYNTLGQVIAETQASADGHRQTLHYGYDVLGNRNHWLLPDGQTIDLLLYGSGHWHQLVLNGQPLVDVERDGLHREVSRTFRNKSPGCVAHPLQRAQCYTAVGQLDTIRYRRGKELIEQQHYHYDPSGALTRIERELDGLRSFTRYEYDMQQRLTAWDRHEVIAPPMGAGHPSDPPTLKKTHALGWAHDPAGNPMALGAAKRIDPVSNQSMYATPDQWAEIVKRNLGNPNFSFLGQSMPRANRVAQYDGVNCEYDASGDLVRRQTDAGVWEFAFDAMHQMTVSRFTPQESSEPTMFASYFYDAFGRRIGKLALDLSRLRYDPDGNAVEGSLPQTLTRFLWDGDRLLQEIHAAQTKTIVYEPNSFVPIAQIVRKKRQNGQEATAREHAARYTEGHGLTQLLNNEAVPSEMKHMLAHHLGKDLDHANNEIHLFLTDHLGTPYRMIDAATHEVVWDRLQDPWGNTIEETISDKLAPGRVPTLRFQGQQYDPEIDLCYNRNRYYDSRMHRYITQDPIRLAGGLNYYAYPLNPVQWVDALGLQPSDGKGFSTRYGNWCGRHWSGGHEGPEIPSNPKEPIDSVDNCCMSHDYCYAEYESSKCKLSTSSKKAGKKQCDKDLVNCIEKLRGKSPSDWPMPPPREMAVDAYVYSQKAKWWFKD